jgi:DnaJ domain
VGADHNTGLHAVRIQERRQFQQRWSSSFSSSPSSSRSCMLGVSFQQKQNYHQYQKQRHQQQGQRRSITTKSAAKRLLGFKSDQQFSVRELRHAYFKMAKSTHPDMKKQFDDVDDDSGKAFMDVTRAYEILLKSDEVQDDVNSFKIPIEEEEEYRLACQLVLGIDATIVEESKTNPMFLHWLMGNTDGAQHWRSFFAVHGGLAQKLRPPAGYLEYEPSSSSSTSSKPRRQRPPRR